MPGVTCRQCRPRSDAAQQKSPLGINGLKVKSPKTCSVIVSSQRPYTPYHGSVRSVLVSCQCTYQNVPRLVGPAEPGSVRFWKQCRSRSVGFWICTICHWVCEFISTIWIKLSDLLKNRKVWHLNLFSMSTSTSGPSCSKLTMSLVNDSLKFTSSYTQICQNFCWKNVSSFCNAKATHIFSAKNIRILNIEFAKTVNEMTLNELVKLTTLWTTGPWMRGNNVNPDWMPRFAESELDLDCFLGLCVLIFKVIAVPI